MEKNILITRTDNLLEDLEKHFSKNNTKENNKNICEIKLPDFENSDQRLHEIKSNLLDLEIQMEDVKNKILDNKKKFLEKL